MTSFSTLPFTPVVIIGAARSGTNALRDALTILPGFETWPCDEINPIWRHGNLRYPDDELPVTAARSDVQNYVRGAFNRIWRQRGCPSFVVEKTCANSLRVPFVDAILPEAKFIYIVRDGIDVVASAQKRWNGNLEMSALPYFLAKARYAPLVDLPSYVTSAVSRRIAIRMGWREHMPMWGPRFAGIERYRGASIEELCARQWAACVDRADDAFSNLTPCRAINLTYEGLISNPIRTLDFVIKALGLDMPSAAIAAAAKTIRGGGAGNGRKSVSTIDDISPILESPLRRHGYI